MENTQNIPDTQVTAQSYAINGLDTETTGQYTYQQNYLYAANLMVNQNQNSYQIKKALLARGTTDQEAETIIDNLEEEVESARREKAQKDMLWGGIWCVGGIAVTAISYSSASGGGGYVVTWGAIIFGGVQFMRGLVASAK